MNPYNDKRNNLHEISTDYIESMIADITEMKAIILDNETQVMFSLEYSKSLALKHEIFLFENIDKIKPEQKFNLYGLFFLRPTKANLEYLKGILSNLNFKEIYLYFTNQINDEILTKLAQYDVNMQIKSVQEIYFDYYVINSNLFHFNIESCIPNLSLVNFTEWNKYDESQFTRITDGLISICLANRVFPIIKCIRGSPICTLISKKVAEYFNNNYDFVKKECSKEQNGILFLVDRKEDPVTPLINQWTYQAMLHELIGIQNNVINLKKDGNLPADKDEKFVISDVSSIDKFFSEQMYNDYGGVADEVEKAAEKLKRENNELSSKNNTIEELRKMIDSLPEKKKESMAITKHYKLFYELSDYVNKHKLMELSPIEQDIACNNNKKDQFNKIVAVLQDPKVSPLDKAKLYLLFVFRYEKDSAVSNLKDLMKENGLRDWIESGDLLLMYCGRDKRIFDVLSNKDLFSKSKKMILNAFGNKDNVFMQHVSFLNDLTEKLIKGKLKENEIDTILRGNESKAKKFIIFEFGGITFEEAKDLTLLGKQNNIPIIAGGTNVINSKNFLAELQMIKNSNFYKGRDESLV